MGDLYGYTNLEITLHRAKSASIYQKDLEGLILLVRLHISRLLLYQDPFQLIDLPHNDTAFRNAHI